MNIGSSRANNCSPIVIAIDVPIVTFALCGELIELTSTHQAWGELKTLKWGKLKSLQWGSI